MRKKLLRFVDAFLVALIMTGIAAVGWLDDFDAKFSDYLYQKVGEKNSDILVVGIDTETVRNFGSPTIRRSDFAKVIENLNKNSDSRPAVIGIDGVFTGENINDGDSDEKLVKAAAEYKNVVVGSEADFDDESYFDSTGKKIWKWIPPFQKLLEVAETGHINAVSEPDGSIRKSFLCIDVTERGKLFSFSRVIYEKYCDYKNIEKNSLPEVAEDKTFYIPFTAENYSADYNFWDVMNGDFDTKIFKDKIVLIGLYAPGMQDATPTSLSRANLMYGVDIHANIIDAFQKNFIPRELDKFPQLIILFAVCFVAEIFLRKSKMKTSTIIWLTIFVSWIIICKIFYQNEIVLHAFWIPFAASILFVGAISTNYILTGIEKNKISSIFSRYVDPVVMNQLLDGGKKSLDLGGKLQNIAVLFVDIRGFTSMSEELPPATVVEILNRYLTLTAECVRKNHGTLDKFVGDCTMAFWNAPVQQKNSVYLACKAAMDMIKNSKKLNDELLEKYGRKISFGIGVHWGSAVVGNIGTTFRMDYTAIGDTVNTAARLESNALGGTVLISEAVKKILGSQANVVSLGNEIKLKGKTDDFEIFMLQSLNEMEGDKIEQ